ncbi:hypothetical protein N7522_001396 [Penicillium canescens]|nr:hypothetical protein N7522_001396 [Penicillium canescens]KAJ6033241.1 hypothetical protein N7444_011012 [Penicillium canescens]
MHYQCQSCYMCFTVREDCEKHMDLKDHRTPPAPGSLPGQAQDGNSNEQLQRSLSYATTSTQLTRALNAYYKHTSIRYNLETGLNESVHSYHSINVILDTTSNRTKNYGCAVCERQFSSLLAVNQHMDVKGHWPGQLQRPQPAPPGSQSMGIAAPEQLWPEEALPALPNMQHDSIDVKDQYNPETGVHFTGWFPCEMCDRLFSTQQGANQHMDVKEHWRQHQDQQRIHTHTSTSIGPNTSIRPHMRAGIRPPRYARPVAAVISFKCDSCERVFNTEDGVIQHMAVKAHWRIFGCDLCYLEFRTRGQLERHIATHDSSEPEIKRQPDVPFERDIPCEICHLVFPTASDADKHMAEVHFCKECGGLVTDTNTHMECSMLYVETFGELSMAKERQRWQYVEFAAWSGAHP